MDQTVVKTVGELKSFLSSVPDDSPIEIKGVYTGKGGWTCYVSIDQEGALFINQGVAPNQDPLMGMFDYSDCVPCA